MFWTSEIERLNSLLPLCSDLVLSLTCESLSDLPLPSGFLSVLFLGVGMGLRLKDPLADGTGDPRETRDTPEGPPKPQPFDDILVHHAIQF